MRPHAGSHRPRSPALSVTELKRSRLYAEELGLDLASGNDRHYFLWFLASLLFGGRISEGIARRTYQSFCRHGLTTPRRILAAGWDFLVNPVMREGGYVRYDGQKSEQILRDCRTLLNQYGGRLSRLHEAARDPADLEARLDAFYGIGPVTTNIFLRELRPFWPKADPTPLPAILSLARTLGIPLELQRRKTLGFTRIEAGLIRLSHQRPGGSRRAPPPRREGGARRVAKAEAKRER